MNIRNLSPWAYGLLHGLVNMAAVSLPILLTNYPMLGKVTIAGAVIWAINWLEQGFSQ